MKRVWLKGRGLAVAAWLLLAVTFAGLAAAAAWDSPPYVKPADLIWAGSVLAFPVVGLVLALKVPTNPIGWLAMAGPAMVLWGIAFDEAGMGLAHLASVGVMIIYGVVILFPDGRYPNRWWRYAHILVVAGLFVELALIPGSDGGLSIGVGLVVTVSALIFRAVKGTPTLRRQMSWPAFVVLLGAAGLLLVGLLPVDAEWLSTALFIFITVGVPTAIAVSVLRYRLYEIDRIVSRTVTYTLVLGALVSVFAATVTVLTQVLPFESDLAVAASTLAVAALFTPLRRRSQDWVDRQFNRPRYVAAEELQAFTERLKNITDVAAVEADLAAAAMRTLEPSTVTVWTRSTGVGGPG